MAIYYLRSSDGSDASDGLTWANAKLTLAGIIAIGLTSADTCYVQNTHAESLGSSDTFVFPEDAGFQLISVSDTNEPPTTLAAMTALTEGWVTSGNFSIKIEGALYGYGLSFVTSNAAGNSSADMYLGSNSSYESGQSYDNCIFGTISTSTSADFVLGLSADSLRLSLRNCTWYVSSTGQRMRSPVGRIFIDNLAVAGAAVPATLVSGYPGKSTAEVWVENTDLHAIGPTNLLGRVADSGLKMIVRNCKLPTGGVTLVTGSQDRWSTDRIEVMNADGADTNYRYSSDVNEGTVDSLNEVTPITRTGGAEHNGTQYSFKMISSANSTLHTPLETPEFVVWNETVTGDVTVTVHIANTVGDLQNDEIWLEASALETSGFPQGALTTDKVALLGTPANQADETGETWGGSPTYMQTLAVTIQPREVGFVHCKVMLAAPSITVYVDPKAVIS